MAPSLLASDKVFRFEWPRAVALVGLYLMLEYSMALLLEAGWLQSFAELSAVVVGVLIRSIGQPAVIEGTRLVMHVGVLDMTGYCLPVSFSAVAVAFVLTQGGRIGRRILVALVAVLALMALNVLRVSLLGIALGVSHGAFAALHTYVLPVVMTAATAAIALVAASRIHDDAR